MDSLKRWILQTWSSLVRWTLQTWRWVYGYLTTVGVVLLTVGSLFIGAFVLVRLIIPRIEKVDPHLATSILVILGIGLLGVFYFPWPWIPRDQTTGRRRTVLESVVGDNPILETGILIGGLGVLAFLSGSLARLLTKTFGLTFIGSSGGSTWTAYGWEIVAKGLTWDVMEVLEVKFSSIEPASMGARGFVLLVRTLVGVVVVSTVYRYLRDTIQSGGSTKRWDAWYEWAAVIGASALFAGLLLGYVAGDAVWAASPSERIHDELHVLDTEIEAYQSRLDSRDTESDEAADVLQPGPVEGEQDRSSRTTQPDTRKANASNTTTESGSNRSQTDDMGKAHRAWDAANETRVENERALRRILDELPATSLRHAEENRTAAWTAWVSGDFRKAEEFIENSHAHLDYVDFFLPGSRA